MQGGKGPSRRKDNCPGNHIPYLPHPVGSGTYTPEHLGDRDFGRKDVFHGEDDEHYTAFLLARKVGSKRYCLGIIAEENMDRSLGRTVEKEPKPAGKPPCEEEHGQY